MIVTIDTNVLVNGFSDIISKHFLIISYIAREDDPTKVGHDYVGHISCEYRRNLDRDGNFRKWYGRLQQLQKIHYCDHHIDNRHLLRLRALGCHEAADHVFIGVALHSDKVLISEDRGVGKGPRGNQSPHPEALEIPAGADGDKRVRSARGLCKTLASTVRLFTDQYVHANDGGAD